MNLLNYFKETKAELKEVVFPTLAQTITFTVAVITLSLLVAVGLGAIDIGLKEGLVKLLAR
ncbi:MAG: SecE/Sec61-gamma subunit of protein translocation complex [Candidatus Parcubacteria bacterium]|jgi:preprotein translocase SecE subunit